LKENLGANRINYAKLADNQAIYTTRLNLHKSTKFLATNKKEQAQLIDKKKSRIIQLK
jgi:hypothetical protein